MNFEGRNESAKHRSPATKTHSYGDQIGLYSTEGGQTDQGKNCECGNTITQICPDHIQIFDSYARNSVKNR